MDDRRKTIPPIISPIVDEQGGNDEQMSCLHTRATTLFSSVEP